MFEVAVDGFGGIACGVGEVEVGQDISGLPFERSSQCDDLCEGGRDARAAGDVLARCSRGIHREHPRPGARRGKDP